MNEQKLIDGAFNRAALFEHIFVSGFMHCLALWGFFALNGNGTEIDYALTMTSQVVLFKDVVKFLRFFSQLLLCLS